MEDRRWPYQPKHSPSIITCGPYLLDKPIASLSTASTALLGWPSVNIVKPCPGIGWATTVVVFFLNCYYNVILTWSFYYMFASFTTKLPWESCTNSWNTENCSTFSTVNETLINSTVNNSHLIDSTTEYWE